MQSELSMITLSVFTYLFLERQKNANTYVSTATFADVKEHFHLILVKRLRS